MTSALLTRCHRCSEASLLGVEGTFLVSVRHSHDLHGDNAEAGADTPLQEVVWLLHVIPESCNIILPQVLQAERRLAVVFAVSHPHQWKLFDRETIISKMTFLF